MLVVFRAIFLADKKIIYGYNFVAPLRKQGETIIRKCFNEKFFSFRTSFKCFGNKAFQNKRPPRSTSSQMTTQVSSFEYFEIFKNTFFTKHLW